MSDYLPAWPPPALITDHGMRWDRQSAAQRALHAPYIEAPALEAAVYAPWALAAHASAAVAAHWEDIPRRDAAAGAGWGDFLRWLDAGEALRWLDSIACDDLRALAWDDSLASQDAAVAMPYHHPPPKDWAEAVAWDTVDIWGRRPDEPGYAPPAADNVDFALASGYTPPVHDRLDFALRPPSPGRPIEPRQPLAIIPWGDHSETPETHMDQACVIPWGPGGDPMWWLNPGPAVTYGQDGPEGSDLIVGPCGTCNPKTAPPWLWSYSTMASIEVLLQPDNIPILCNSFRISADSDSWAWQFSLGLARREDLEAVKPAPDGTPREVLITVNGFQWRAIIERDRVSRTLRKSAFSVTGRGPVALLSETYAPVASAEQPTVRAINQLAAEALEYHPDWSVQWDAQTWTVQGSTWAYQDLAPLGAIAEIAKSIRAQVLGHRVDKVIHITPRYCVAPWEAADSLPCATIPHNIITELSGELRPKPAYNAAVAMGQGSTGVIVTTIRNGTAGDVVAPQATHKLITAVEAGRERGKVEIASSGNKRDVTVKIPLFAEMAPGLVEPGTLCEVNDGTETWRGICRSCEITGTRQRATSVRQTLTIERGYLQ